MKTLEQALIEPDGSYRPFHLELVENSGPVSPAYQYRTRVVIRTIEHDVLFSFKDERRFQAGVAQEKIDVERSLSKEEYQKIVSFLLAQKIFELTVDRTKDKRDRLGISYNHLDVRLGPAGDTATEHARIDYVLSDLDDSSDGGTHASPGFQAQKRVIEFVKSLR
ncbi:MAG: hypothetical protein HY042_01570 [Spirochaetia bacterium]|nr:hypothetical protein [Spirochaetia bacterium]